MRPSGLSLGTLFLDSPWCLRSGLGATPRHGLHIPPFCCLGWSFLDFLLGEAVSSPGAGIVDISFMPLSPVSTLSVAGIFRHRPVTLAPRKLGAEWGQVAARGLQAA